MSDRKREKQSIFMRHRLLWLPLIVHFFFVSYSAGDTEFWGDDEAAVVDLAGDQWVGLSEGPGELTMSLGRAGHPPLRYLAVLPFVALSGSSEWGGRAPGILASLGILLLLYSLLRTHLAKGILLGVLMLYSVSGVLAINRSPNGTGLYVFLVLLAFWFSERTLRNESASIRQRKLAFGAMCMATLTYLEGVLHIPSLLWLHRKALWQDRLRSLLRYLAIPGLVGGLYLLFFYVLPEPLFGRPTGALEHLRARSGNLGWHLHPEDFAVRASLILSPFFLGLFTLSALALWFRRAHIHFGGLIKRALLYYVPHLLVWLVLFPADFHELLNYPLFFTLLGLGLQVAWEWAAQQKHSARYGRGIGVFLVFVFLCSAHDSYVVHVDTSHAKGASWSGFEEREWWGPIAFARKLGLKSLAFKVLEEDPGCHDGVSADVGGAFASFYLRGRAKASLTPDEVLKSLESGNALPKSLRYLGLRCDRGKSRCFPARLATTRRFELKVGEETSFVLYDFKGEKNEVVAVQSGAYDEDWSAGYGAPRLRSSCFLERRSNKSSP
jgi:hypothetical protein